jgi:HK97 family phage major capsid protein
VDQIKDLQEKRGILANQIKTHADKQDAWTAEDRQIWDKLNADVDAVEAEITAEAKRLNDESAEREAIAKRLEAVSNYQAPPVNDFRRKLGRDGGSIEDGPRHRNIFEKSANGADGDFRVALQGWFRAKHNPADAGEVTDSHRMAAARCGINLNSTSVNIRLADNVSDVRNALSTTSGPGGGYTFNDSFVSSLEQAMLAYGGVMNVADIIRTSTAEPMRWPTVNDTTNTGRQINESAATSNATDPSFAQKTWYAYKFTSDTIFVPFELFRESAFDMAGLLASMLGERLGRIQATKYTTGSGANTPTGIVTEAAAGVTAASATAILLDEVLDLVHSIDPSRREMSGVGFMFHDNILKALRKLKDGNGLYLWQAGTTGGAPSTIWNYPYQISQDMASAIQASAVTMLFGQLSQFKVRQVNGVRLYRLTEKYRENDQDAFLAFVEGDSKLLDAGDSPVKKLTQA